MVTPSVSESRQVIFVPTIDKDPLITPPIDTEICNAPIVKGEFLPIDTPEDRVYNKLLKKGIVIDEEINSDFKFPSLPALSFQEGDLKPLFSFLQRKIKIHDQQKGWTTQKELWELFACLKNLNGVENVHLVGGEAMSVLTLAWHMKAAKSLKIFDEDDLKDLEKALSSLRHKPKDSDIRFYSPKCNSLELDRFNQTALRFLSTALCEVKKKHPTYREFVNFKNTCLDNLFHCPEEGNDYSIIGFGNGCQSSTEIMLVHRLHRNFLFLNHAFEIPLEDAINVLKEKKGKSALASEVVKRLNGPQKSETLAIQPSCFSMNAETGELSQVKNQKQWEALLSFWLKRLHTKKSEKINKNGWPRSLICEVEGITRRASTLSERLYEKMIHTIISENKIPEIMALLNKSVKEHLGEDRFLFAATAFQACLSLKDKFKETEQREIWKGMLSYSQSLSNKADKQKIPPNPFFVLLEKLIDDNSIPFQFIADLILLKGLFSISQKEEKADLSFYFKQHQGKPTIQVRILGPKICCLNLPFDGTSFLNNILSNSHFFDNPLVAEFCNGIFKETLGGEGDPIRLKAICEALNFPLDKWETAAYESIGQNSSFIKELGWDLLKIICRLKPSDRGIKTLLSHILELFSQGNKQELEIQKIFHTLDISLKNCPEIGQYLTLAVESLRQYLNRIGQEKYDPAVFSKNHKEMQIHRTISWLQQLAHSSDEFMVELAEGMAKIFFDLDPAHIVHGYSLVEIFAGNARFQKAINLMQHLQDAKKGRVLQEEIDCFCSLSQKIPETDPSHLKSLGKIALKIMDKWNPKNDERPKNILLFVQSLELLWEAPEYAQPALQTFQLMVKKEVVNSENLPGKFWIDACDQALNHSNCGISFAMDVWKKGLKKWKTKIDKSEHAEFCIQLLQALHNNQISYAGMYAGDIFEELFSIIQSFKDENYEVFLRISRRVECLASQIKYVQAKSVKNSVGKEFLFRLRIGEISFYLEQGKWNAALNALHQVLQSDLKAIEASYYPLLIELVERVVNDISLSSAGIPNLIEIIKLTSFEEILNSYPEKYISILSSALTKVENASTNACFHNQLLDLYLKKVNSSDDLVSCAPALLKIWTRRVKEDAGYAKILKPDLILQMLLKAELDQELASTLIFLKSKSLLNQCFVGQMDCVWKSLGKLSLSSAGQDLQLCYNALKDVLRANLQKTDPKEIVQILKNLLTSNQCFQVSEIFKELTGFTIDLESVNGLIEACRCKDLETQFYLLKLISQNPLYAESVEQKWQELLSKCDKENFPDLFETIELYALRYSQENRSDRDEKILYNALLKRDFRLHLDATLGCLGKYKILSVDLWKAVLNVFHTQNHADFFPLCKIFLTILNSPEGDGNTISKCWEVFFEASQQLPLSQWLPLMKGLPEISQICEFKEPLYNKIIAKGLDGLSESFNEDLFLDLMALRRKLAVLKTPSITPQDLKFFEWAIHYGNENCILEIIKEIENNKQGISLFIIKLCSRLIEESFQKDKSNLAWLEKTILELFKNSLSKSGNYLPFVFQKVISCVSFNGFYEIITYLFENFGDNFYQLASADIKNIINKLVRINTSKSYEIALELIFLNNSALALKNKVILGLLQHAVKSRNVLEKHKILVLFCKNYPAISKDGKLKEMFEQAVVDCIALIPESKENWVLFNTVLNGVIDCMHPMIQRNNWKNLVENELDKDLSLVVFGENVSYLKENTIEINMTLNKNKKVHTAKSKPISVRKKRTQLSSDEIEYQNFCQFYLKLANSLIDHFSTEEVFEKTEPNIIFSIIQLLLLQFNDIIIKTKNSGRDVQKLFEMIENVTFRLAFDFSFINESLNNQHYEVIKKFNITYSQLLIEKSLSLYAKFMERAIYFDAGSFLELKEIDMHRLKNNHILLNLVTTLIKKRKKSSFLKSLNLLRIGYKFLPFTIKELKPLYEKVLSHIGSYIDDEIDNVSTVEELRITIFLHAYDLCTTKHFQKVTGVIEDRMISAKDAEEVLVKRYEFSCNLFSSFFNQVLTNYQKPQNNGKKIKIEDKELSLKEYLLFTLKEAREHKIFLINQSAYKELLTTAINL